MKKNLLIVVLLMLCLAINVRAQWQVYDASDLPVNSTPAWNIGDVTNGAVVNIVDDGFISGNKLLTYSATQTAKNSWKLNITRADSAAWLFRIKSTKIKDYGMQFEMNTNTTRVDLKIGNSPKGGYLKFTATTPAESVIYPADSTLDVGRWHIYRITVEGGNLFKLYLDENPTPVAQLTSTRASQTQFLRFGYFTSSGECEGVLDWMAWDVSDTYAPGSGTAIPDSLSTSKALVGYFNNDDRTMASTAVAFDNDPVIQMLEKDPNFDVDVKIVAVDSLVDMSPYDIVIVQEGFTSGAAILKPGGSLALENITVPFIYNKAYSLRNTRAVTSATATANQIPANQLHLVVEAGKETHPLFSGITISDSIKMFKASASDDGSVGAKTMNYASDLEMSDTTTLLARLKGATGNISVCFNDIPAGTVLGTEDTLKARMIAIGENYGAISMDMGRNLTDENMTIWRNAVYLLAGLEVPTYPAEAPSRIEIGYFNNADRTMTATAIPFEEDPIIQMLKGDQNFNVDVKIVAVDSVVDLSPYDIVIVQEAFTSSAAIFQPGGSLALENIAVPFIYNKAYALRNGKAVTSATATANQIPANQLHIVVQAGKETHPLFTAITMDSDSIKLFKAAASDDGSAGAKTINFASDLEMSDTTTLLAKLKGATGNISVSFNDIPAGTVLGTQDTLKARMIAISENYGAISKDLGRNLTDENMTIWRNAVYLLAGFAVPSYPVEAPSRIEVGYFNNADRTMVATAALFEEDPVIQMLREDINFNVDVKIVAVDSVIDLSPYDIVVVQEAFSSGAAILLPGGSLALENITVPFIYNKAYALRNGKAVTSATATAGQTPANQLHIVVEAGKATHPLFSGITMDSDSIKIFKTPASDDGGVGAKTINFASDLEMSDTTTLLAKLKGAAGNVSVCLNDIPAGSVLGTEDTLKARMIAISENYGAISRDMGANLTDAGLTIWRNAFYLLAGLEVPDTSLVSPLSSNAYLSGIILSSGALVPAFNKDTVDYAVELAAGTTSVNVTATAEHPLAGVTGSGAIDVSGGSGTATIIVTAENGTATMTYMVEFTVLPEGIEETLISTIRVYPTVSDRWFNVEAEGDGMIKVYDMVGRMISFQKLSGNTARVEISEAGIYLLDIETDSQRKVVRVVKTK